jgi:hypothetical protein
MRFLMPTALAVALLTSSAAAQTPSQTPSTIMGVGVLSCSAWTTARHEGGALEHGAWVLGFLCGIRTARISWPSGEVVDHLLGTDRDGVLAWIDNYCQARPLEKVVAAAWARRSPRNA